MRNQGIDASSGDPVILLEGDIEFTPRWYSAAAPGQAGAGTIGTGRAGAIRCARRGSSTMRTRVSRIMGMACSRAETIEVLCRAPTFLALNVQSNAGNRGFNTMLKYARASDVCMAEHEAQMEIRHR